MSDGIAVSTGRWAAAPLQRVRAGRGRIDSVAIAGLTLGALALGLYRSNSTSLWTDELFSVTLASKPLPVLLRQLWSENANMSLYYLILGGWLNLLNHLGIAHPTEWLIRLPSIVFAAGALVAAYFVAKRLFGSVVGLVGATLLMLNYVFLMEVAQARAYSLELFLQLVGWYLLIRILEHPTRNGGRLGVAFGAVMGLALYADLYTALVIFTQLAAFLALIGAGSISRARAREALRPALIASLTIIVGCTPLALDVVLHGAANDWIAAPGLREVLAFAGAVAGANPAFALALVVGGALGLGIALRRPDGGESERISPRAGVILLATWIAVPFALSWGLSHHPFGQHLFLTRYLLPIVPAICLLCAAGLYSISRTRVNVGRFMLVAAVLLAVTAVPEYYSRVQREDFRTASVWLAQRYQSGDGVACASLGCAFALEYYAPHRLQADAPGQYVWNAGRFDHIAVDPATLGTYAQTHNRIFFVYGTAGQSVYISPDEQWLQAHRYSLLNRIETVAGSAGTVTVELWAQQE
jgi:mannosyltransferase